MKKLILLVLGMISGGLSTFSCTTFLLSKNGQYVFGRNYDWITDAGIVCTNLRGLSKTSVSFEGKSITWVSTFGSITFNQYGKEFPMGGMNEKGLVVELMWLDGSVYPQPDDRPGMSVLQWVQFQLDNCSTIEEVIASDRKIRISPAGSPPLHYLVADGSGHAATIEFLNGKMVVHKGNNLPLAVLTNTDYATATSKVKQVNAMPVNERAAAFNDNSLQRFAQACSMVNKYQQRDISRPIVNYAFEILDKVSVEGFTKWSIVYDISNKKILFKTVRQAEVKSVRFADMNFDCSAKAMSFDMNQPMKGNVVKLFHPFTDEMNYKIVHEAVEETRRKFDLTDEDVKRIVGYTRSVKCEN